MNMAAITDAKSLYDNLVREQYSGAEKRAALEICVIKDSLDSLGGTARWVPHEKNPVDCVTKLKGNASEMLTLLRKGKYRLTDETLELEARKEYRERTGRRNPRPNRFTDAAPKKGNQQHGSVCFMYSNATVTPPLLYMNSVDYDSDTSAATCGLTCEDNTTAFPAIPEAMSLTRDVKLPADPKEEIPSSGIALNQTMAAQMHARHSLQRLDDNLSRLEKMVAMMLKAEGVQTPAELRSKLQERVEQADNTAAANYKLERLETLTNEQKVQQNQKDEILQRMKAIAPIMLGEAQERTITGLKETLERTLADPTKDSGYQARKTNRPSINQMVR